MDEPKTFCCGDLAWLAEFIKGEVAEFDPKNRGAILDRAHCIRNRARVITAR